MGLVENMMGSDQHIVNTASLDGRSGEMRGRVQRLVSSLLMPGAWLLVMVAHWRWYRADTAQPSPAQLSPAQPRMAICSTPPLRII